MFKRFVHLHGLFGLFSVVFYLALASFSPLLMAEERGAGKAMADAMTRMMEVMGFSASDAPTQIPEQAMDQMMGAVMDGQDTPEALPLEDPWSAPFGDPLWTFGLPERWQAFGGLFRWRSTTLEGVWEGRDGGLLIIQGYRFRLYQPGSGHRDGFIQQRGDRVALYNPLTGVALPYESAQQDGRLVLRDAAGQLFLYRRLWLEQ